MFAAVRTVMETSRSRLSLRSTSSSVVISESFFSPRFTSDSSFDTWDSRST